MTHEIDVPTAKTHAELGTKIGQLRYDAMIIVLSAFKREIELQMVDDIGKNRIQIAERGSQLIGNLDTVTKQLRRMLMIASPHIQQELREFPLIEISDEF